LPLPTGYDSEPFVGWYALVSKVSLRLSLMVHADQIVASGSVTVVPEWVWKWEQHLCISSQSGFIYCNIHGISRDIGCFA